MLQVILSVFLLGASFSLFSVPIGNPAAPAILQRGFFIPDTSFSNLQVGYLADFLFYKRFQPRKLSHSMGLHKTQLKGTSQIANIAWNIFERLNVQVELGSGQFQWQSKMDQTTFVSGQLSDGLLWSGSAKAVFFEVKETTIAADAHVGGWDWMCGHSTSNAIPVSSQNHSEMRYWQLAAAVTQKINLFSPYIGIAANQTKLKISDISQQTGWFRSRHKLGPFGGCTISSGSKFFLNLEWRASFEQAFSVSGQFRF